MITGEVNADQEAILFLTVHGQDGQEETEAMLDSGFTGYLTLPPTLISLLGLTLREQGEFTVAGGDSVEFPIYEATVIWDGQARTVLALASDSIPLVGMSLLKGYRVCFDAVDGGPVTIIPIP